MALNGTQHLSTTILCYNERRKGREGSDRKASRKPRGTRSNQSRHSITGRHRGGKSRARVQPTGTHICNNHTKHNPVQARPPKATITDSRRKQTPAAQDHEVSRERAPRPGTTRRRQGLKNPPSPGSKGAQKFFISSHLISSHLSETYRLWQLI
jgi:hypothetical protein